MQYWIHPSRPIDLLRAMMRTLTGPSQISFEGSLNDRDFWGAWTTIPEGESYLKRQTSSPRLDLIILPLSAELEASLSAYLGEHQAVLDDDRRTGVWCLRQFSRGLHDLLRRCAGRSSPGAAGQWRDKRVRNPETRLSRAAGIRKGPASGALYLGFAIFLVAAATAQKAQKLEEETAIG